MGFNFGSKQAQTRRYNRYSGALLGTSALLALAGCGGGGSSNNGGNNGNGGDNSTLTSANLAALTNDNRLLTFNSRTPGTSTTVNITGLTSGDSLRAIDFRFAAGIAGDGQTGLYGVAQNGASQQIYRLAVTGNAAAATKVGARFNLIPATPAATAFGFDFNPTVDRIRLVEPTSNRDLRLNPNADANTSPIVDFDLNTEGTQPDGPLNYAAGDAGAGQNPDAVGAAYSNIDADAATATTLYVLDAARNTLATQGRADDPATVGTDETVSPNSGSLFTIGNLGLDITENTGFDISPNGNAAFLSNGSRIYGVAIAPGTGRGATSGGASVIAPGNSRIIGLAVTQ
ncbi:protein of unknown function (DUF4394) [Abditibacterium utsteinense]|uniref:DUF4394 domain-containing protein n=1 Tax=Abditibacterium utsteinense TaxID=1960156 RepID=A0A2S8SS84_9BACT|nr:DUF4394 domain-containing protein [Abditibacterium utsteinense]PQV63660.1 protein of unknown function (DUF4394) [Abditibacterium utsteinense]